MAEVAPGRLWWRLAQQVPVGRRVSWLGLLLGVQLTEGVGLLLLLPLLQLLQAGPALVPGGWPAWLAGLGMPLHLEALLGLFLGLIFLRSLLLYAQELLAAQIRLQLVEQLRQRCFAALLGVEWRWLLVQRRSDYAHLVLTEVNRVGAGLQFAVNLVLAGAALLAYLGVATVLSWPMTLLATLSGALVFGLLAYQRRAALRLGQTLSVAHRAMQATVQESLAALKLIKVLGHESRQLAWLAHTGQHLHQQQWQFAISHGLARAGFQIGGALLLVALLYLGWRVMAVPVAELLILVLIFSRVIPAFTGMQQHYQQLLHATPALAALEQLLADCQQAAEPPAPLPASPWPVRQAIELHQVGVTYPQRTLPALQDVNLILPVRTTTALVGASGSGKSTLADVLLGLLTPDQGELRVDGVPVTGAARLRWRQAVAYVPQETFLFHASIRENLLWGNPAATTAQLTQALQQAAADFVQDLPQGLDTVVGDGGICLSGGERQRLALARALLAQPGLLILDEATSALDMAHEARVRAALEQLHGDLTVLLIGHRLATLEHADQVVVLGQGRILAQGSWAAVQTQVEVKLG